MSGEETESHPLPATPLLHVTDPQCDPRDDTISEGLTPSIKR